jgi:outer membrane protein
MTKGDWVISGTTGLGFNNVTTTIKADGNSVDGPKLIHSLLLLLQDIL